MRKLLVATTVFAALGTAVMADPSPAFMQGLNDRQNWESWFNGLSGQYQNGAYFWAGQRSLPHPATCFAEGGRDLGDWTSGCVAAQQRLALSDIRRKAEPEYKAGWNGWSPGVVEALRLAQEQAAMERRAQAEQAAAERRAQAERDAAAVQRAADEQAEADRVARRKAQEERDAAAARQARIDAENRAAAQLAAENSPDNRCKEPKIAGELIQDFNSLQAAQDVRYRAIDIEHLTTLSFKTEEGKNIYACHGAFVLTNGRRVTGNLSTRLNVAHNIIISFTVDDE